MSTLPNHREYKGHEIIAPDTEILNGVFLANGAIVVDIDDNPEVYEELYRTTEEAVDKMRDTSAFSVATAVNWSVEREVLYSPHKTAAVLKKQAAERGIPRIGVKNEIPLSDFIQAKAGICYHQSLAIGSMLRLLQQRRGIESRVSIERTSNLVEAHTWVRYSDEAETVIIDNSWHVISRLDANAKGIHRGYLRPEEQPKTLMDLGKTLLSPFNFKKRSSLQQS